MGNSVFLSACDRLEKVVLDTRTKDELLQEYAKEKLFNIYNKENEEFDLLLEKLEQGIDYGDYSQVKKSVTRIMRILSRNRAKLFSTLERLV